jgi:hypothetical protein
MLEHWQVNSCIWAGLLAKLRTCSVKMSILAGINDLADEWLALPPKGKKPFYKHTAALKHLAASNDPISASRPFLDRCYEQIDSNWRDAVEKGLPVKSEQNWRWKRHPEIGENNSSPELRLQRAIINACGDNWSNEMPVASGLYGSNAHRRAAIDLVHRGNPETFTFIELKVSSDTPLYAAIEILAYGLLFVWSRDHAAELNYDLEGQPVLKANEVTFEVLAPDEYFERFDLSAIASSLNAGLKSFGEDHGMQLGFSFRSLGPTNTIFSDEANLADLVKSRQSVYPR